MGLRCFWRNHWERNICTSIYASVSKTDFYQHFSHIAINAGDFIFPETVPTQSHLPFKVILGQFCTLLDGSIIYNFYFRNSLSFPQNQGKNSAPESADPADSVWPPWALTATRSVSTKKPLLPAGRWQKWDSCCPWGGRAILLGLEVCALGTMATFWIKDTISMQILVTIIIRKLDFSTLRGYFAIILNVFMFSTFSCLNFKLSRPIFNVKSACVEQFRNR